MMKMITTLVVLLGTTFATTMTTTGCIEDGDAVPDACPAPTDQPDGGTTVTPPDGTTTSCIDEWSCTTWGACSNNVQSRTCTKTVECSTDNIPMPPTTESCTSSPVCTKDSDCAPDNFAWTADGCTQQNVCAHWPNDCGGMEVESANGGSITCGFWGGFGVPPGNAADLGRLTINGNWMSSPTHACSVDDCRDSSGNPAKVNTRIQWNGFTQMFQTQTLTGLSKGTFDGVHTEQ